MKEMNRTYYLVWKRTVAKRKQREKLYEDYIFRMPKRESSVIQLPR